MTLFKNKYRIESSRKKNHNYNSKASYFITIVTANRKPFFGEKRNQEIILNKSGIISNRIWLEIPIKFENVATDEFVIMPNHMHGIIHVLGQNKTTYKNSTSKLTEKQHILGEVIRWYKAKVTFEIRRLSNPDFGWLPRYHDRIIRSVNELNAVRNYIKNNPLQP